MNLHLQFLSYIFLSSVHTGDQPYPCISCGEGFMTRPDLNQHIRTVHGGVNPNSSNTASVPSNAVITSQQQTQTIQVC